jgi:hypothetical protein
MITNKPLFTDNLEELFKEQLEKTITISNDIKKHTSNNYFNDEKIIDNDVVLYALIQFEYEKKDNYSSAEVKLCKLNQNHFHLFEGRSVSTNGIPYLKFKK